MQPASREQLKDYCLKYLGHPVIEINVDDDQIEDRIDDALQFFAEYHFDGAEKLFIKYQVTQADIDAGSIDLKYGSSQSTGLLSTDSQQTPTEAGVDPSKTVKIEDRILSVLGVFHFSQSTINMFDVRYQYALNDLYTFGTIELVHYTVTMQYLQLLRQMLAPDKAIRFNRTSNRLYIDTKWNTQIRPGDYLIIEAYGVIDATVYPEVYDDILLKRYATALIKKQWASNLTKYNNVLLPGGVSFNGSELLTQALTEIKEIEDTVQSKWSLPPDFIVG